MTTKYGPYELGDLAQVEAAQKVRRIGHKLNRAWAEQWAYNTWVQDAEGTNDPDEWTQIWLLGLVSEVDEVLRELQWKRHRKRDHKRVILGNMGRELADMFKYVMSICQAWGFSPEEMLDFVLEKNEVLEAQWRQEQDHPLPHPDVLLTDLDGVVADYREGLARYLENETGATDHRKMFYQMDLATGLDYDDYHHLKDRFEEEGGYRMLPEYPDAVRTLQWLQPTTSLCAVTARPTYLARIWSDTYFWWLRYMGHPPDRLWLAGGDRLRLAKQLREKGHRVAVWEDGPIEALRYAEHGFHVWLREADYNQDVSHQRIHRVSEYIPGTNYFGRED